MQTGDISLHMTVHVRCTKYFFQPSNMGQVVESQIQIWVWLNMRNHCLTATSPINSDISPMLPVAATANKQFYYCLVAGGFWVCLSSDLSLWSSSFFSSTLGWTGDAKLPLSVSVCILYPTGDLLSFSVCLLHSDNWDQNMIPNMLCLYCHG